MDSKNKDIYVKNAEKYLEKLSNLDEQYQNTIQNSKRNTLLFVDRFPFRYLVDDYNLHTMLHLRVALLKRKQVLTQ